MQKDSSGKMVVNVPWESGGTYTLPQATSSVLGGIKLGSATTQSVAANTASSTSGRTYPVQVNSSGQAVVNVPWTDTDTKYTLPAATGSALGGVYLLLSSGAENMLLGFGAKNPYDSSSEWFHIDTAKILISGITNQVINFKTAFKKVPMVLINAVGTAGNEQTWAQAQKITNVTTSSFTVSVWFRNQEKEVAHSRIRILHLSLQVGSQLSLNFT